MALTKDDIKMIGDEMVRQLGPVHDKLDALTGDVIELQDRVGVLEDQGNYLKEKLNEFARMVQNEINRIKKHIGLPVI